MITYEMVMHLVLLQLSSSYDYKVTNKLDNTIVLVEHNKTSLSLCLHSRSTQTQAPCIPPPGLRPAPACSLQPACTRPAMMIILFCLYFHFSASVSPRHLVRRLAVTFSLLALFAKVNSFQHHTHNIKKKSRRGANQQESKIERCHHPRRKTRTNRQILPQIIMEIAK